MRMWMINPNKMCDQHLLGEHGELHKFLPSFHKQYRITNRIQPVVQIELSSYKKRHDELAEEMVRRGMNHKSPLPPLPDFSYLPQEHYYAKVDKRISREDLMSRCLRCKSKMEM